MAPIRDCLTSMADLYTLLYIINALKNGLLYYVITFPCTIRNIYKYHILLAFVSVGELEDDLNLSDDAFEEKHRVRKPDKENDEIVFSCMRGNRSRRAADIAFKQNYKK